MRAFFALLLLAALLTACETKRQVVNAEDADLDIGRTTITCQRLEDGSEDCSNRVQARDYEVIAPDSIRVLINTDGHPTMNRICFDGLAFLTVSSTHSGEGTPAYQRIPEWDEFCPRADADDVRDQTEEDRP